MTPRFRVEHSLNGKVALITGAARGIGKGIARGLASCGANVLLVCRERAAGEKGAAELCDAGGRAAFHSGDVTNLASMRTAAEKAVARYGSLDILCANAGIFPSSSLVELSGDQWDEVFNVNAKGTLFSVQASLPFLRKSNAGRIVVTSSITGPTRAFPAGAITVPRKRHKSASSRRPPSSFRNTESPSMRFFPGISRRKDCRS